MAKRLGLIVNPIAGMGGRVGLKGTDGEEILRRAVQLGAQPKAEERATQALKVLLPHKEKLKVITCSGRMGENAAKAAGFQPEVAVPISEPDTTAAHTREAAKVMAELDVQLLLFAGGDGTARDIYQAIGESLTVLGIPAGVKIHSAVYAVNPIRAGELALKFLLQPKMRTVETEVMDLDENHYRQGVVSARLFGYLKVPFERRLLQGRKAATPRSERYNQEAIAAAVVERMQPDFYYLIGPGTTTRQILNRLKLEGSLLGVDLVLRNQLVGSDLNEDQILEAIAGKKVQLILTPIGGQGYLLGRGNQQISPDVIRTIGKENLIIIATEQKLAQLNGQALLVDTGDPEVDEYLCGYYRIITGYRNEVVYPVTC